MTRFAFECAKLAIFIHFSIFDSVSAHRILGVFPHHGLSHFKVFEPLMLELARRGHEVVVISRYPQNKTVTNYTDINVNNEAPFYNEELPFTSLGTIPMSLLNDLRAIYKFLEETEDIFNTKNFRDFLRSTPKFDLMIVETFNSRLFFALAHILQVPYIALSSTVLFAHASMAVANPIDPAYIPAIASYYSQHMNFWQRLDNVRVHLVTMIGMEFFLNAKAEELKEKYFGEDLPPLTEIAKNVSLTLVNSISTLNGPRPLVPGIVEIGGMFLKPAKPIPKDIEKFINESTHGVVYFCMGSLLRGETFPEEKRNAFLRAFARLPQRVLWKWEGDSLPGKSDNIMIAKWMPQRDILAHPNVKLFISHGGLLGTSEAVYEGVPILGIPIFGDQRTNLKSIESNGAGEILDYNEISEEVVYEKITRLLNNPQYKKNAVDLSIRYKDRPMSPLDTAVYWTEYVIRHKGAPHLKTAAVHMPWHEYLLLDVIAFLFVVSVTALIIMYYTLKFTLRFIYYMIFGSKNRSPESQEKIKKS